MEGQILPPENLTNEAIAERLTTTARKNLETGSIQKKNLIYLELNGCSGNIISLLNGQNPDFEYTLNSMVHLRYSNSLMAAEGEQAIEQLLTAMDEEYILAVEGAVALKNNGLYNIIGSWKGEPLTGLQAAKMLGEKASHILAVGACATHGGVSAAKPNPTQSVGLQEVLPDKSIIKLPGCPVHPDWFLGTLAHLLLYGEPETDNLNRPLMFYSTLIHDRCPRRPFFDRGIFAEKLSDKTCLFKLGCRGPVTRVDCPTRQWNGHVNWPIGANTPCIGCASFGFPDAMAPFISYDTTRVVKDE
ncbi:hydrogenase small subunit [Sporosarcina pasteurii]|uniref:Uptake hydrogenase small subunit n=1 Tax=Sporosarcina pasteurii TaxID=1474 RepID=A0A380BP76_SPOPA|nr:hydrogenase small subunit [Sporosarcina pasteurii]MDS9470960.1 hydrogenase small subunit [Sporosarcina pasteurii]QBQ05387.1 Ni/Fe hydrogenase [Sporosarcina pasteurii]SUJ03462.1 Uptake hydrogenase small subunit precursor [Sporosarcina pasteurii]